MARGYGQAVVNGKVRQVHRVLYQHFKGPISDDLPLDHLCHTRDLNCPGGECAHRACVNPNDLEPVTHQENMRRGVRARKTHCRKNHPYEGENLYVDKHGKRHCKECRRGNVRRHYARSDGAAYMRDYRAKRKAADETEEAK